MKVSIFWFRRDLRLDDNRALSAAASAGHPILPLFIFDTTITSKLKRSDARITFIYDTLSEMNTRRSASGSSMLIRKGEPAEVLERLIGKYEIAGVWFNDDFEPYGIERDQRVRKFFKSHGIETHSHTDHVIFNPADLVKNDGTPYTVYTPYSKRWKEKLAPGDLAISPSVPNSAYLRENNPFPTLESLGFSRSATTVKPVEWESIPQYGERRDRPAYNTTLAGPHLRFGTLSIREIARIALRQSPALLGELIWREFFIQVLFHFPRSAGSNFKRKYNGIKWLNDETLFARWCEGSTGYPLVDAGMKELRQTGYMHNRVRMVAASFLCKHLLIDWRWGEAWFAAHLLDYELASNAGNWQWAAGTGCDAAPWFRVFNPTLQAAKFDPSSEYIKRWIPGYSEGSYIEPVVKHEEARVRAIETYRNGIELLNE